MLRPFRTCHAFSKKIDLNQAIRRQFHLSPVLCEGYRPRGGRPNNQEGRSRYQDRPRFQGGRRPDRRQNQGGMRSGQQQYDETLLDESENKNFLQGKKMAQANMDHLEDANVTIEGIDPVAVKVFGEKKHLSDYDNILHKSILRNLSTSGFETFTPIQRYTLPFALRKRADLLGNAQTGSGKTIAFLIPIINDLLENNAQNKERFVGRATPKSLVIAPTRELAVQLNDEFKKYARGTGLRSQLIMGGNSVSMASRLLLEQNPEVLFCTPGRLNAFLEEHILSPAKVRSVVLDEADLMMDMGFLPQISKFLKHPEMTSIQDRQTFLFSATLPRSIRNIINDFMKDDKMHVQIGTVGKPGQHIEQGFHKVNGFSEKLDVIKKEVQNVDGLGLIFLKTKVSTLSVARELKRLGVSATLINGDMTQNARQQALSAFKKGRVKVLCATDIASRGLDIPMVDLVVNFDLPNDAESFVHRIGRTGRVGRPGKAISFISENDSSLLPDLVRLFKNNDMTVPDELMSAATDAIANRGPPSRRGGGFRKRGFGKPSFRRR